MKNSNDTIGNRNRDLPTCSAVPQSTALPRAPTACPYRVPNTGWHSGRNTPEEPAEEVVAGHQGPHSESRSQPPAEVSDPPAQRVEERPVECHTRIPRSRRPVAVEDGQAGDESSYSVSLRSPGGNRSLRL